MTEPYITHFYNAGQQFYVRGRHGEYLGTTDGDLPVTRYFSSIGQRMPNGPWTVIGSHDSYNEALAQAAADSKNFYRARTTKLESWSDTFPVPGAEGRFIIRAGWAQDLDSAGSPMGLDDRDLGFWLLGAITTWFGDLRVEDGGPFANTLVLGQTDSTTIDDDWADYQLSGTTNIDPGATATEAMYDMLSSFAEATLQPLYWTAWYWVDTGGTWPDTSDPQGGSPT